MNKKTTTTRKLVLHRETVRHLTGSELRHAVGGMINQSRVSQCECASFQYVCDDPAPSSMANTECTG